MADEEVEQHEGPTIAPLRLRLTNKDKGGIRNEDNQKRLDMYLSKNGDKVSIDRIY